MLRVAVLGFWHVHAVGYAKAAAAHPGVEVVAAWDADPDRGREQARALGLAWHSTLDGVLSRDDVDAVIVGTPTVEHRDVLTAAARAGKHVFTEKVLAPTPAECAEITAAVDAAGVVLVVSLPRLYDGCARAVAGVLDSGALGELTLVRAHLAHGGAIEPPSLPAHFFDPAACGGGALIDLGCHPMYLAHRFLGSLPDTVSATFGYRTGRAVEDNAVAVLGYADGRLGIVEAGFATRRSPFTLELHGSEGSLLYSGADPDRLRLSTDGQWRDVSLPEPGPTPFTQFVEHIRAGTIARDNVRAAVDLTTLMQAAYASADSGAATRMNGAAP